MDQDGAVGWKAGRIGRGVHFESEAGFLKSCGAGEWFRAGHAAFECGDNGQGGVCQSGWRAVWRQCVGEMVEQGKTTQGNAGEAGGPGSEIG